MKEKDTLRIEYKKIRKNIGEKAEKSKSIISKIKDLEIYQKSSVLGIYNSFNDEVDTKELIIDALEHKKIVCLPKVIDENEMVFIKIDGIEEASLPGYSDILEPKLDEEKIVDPKKIDLMIVPGICFDLNKNRVGFGGGYYDKYLKNTASYNIGICYDAQILKDDLIKTTPNDVTPDAVITEEKIYY